MKKNLRLVLAAVIAVSVSFMSCKKTETNNNSGGNNSDLATHSDDQSRVSAGTDEMADDANAVIDNVAAFNGRPNGVDFLPLPCNTTFVLDTVSTTKRLTITYNGVNCYGNYSRTGKLVLTMPVDQHWGDVNAILTTEAQNFKITRIADGKSITINGTSTIKNVTGGHFYELASLGTIIHEIGSTGITVTFDNGSQRSWQVAKKRTFSYVNGIVITTQGNHTEGSVTDISEWGTNRFGGAFTTRITAPMIIRQDCNFRLVSGQVTNEGALGTAVATFGLDASGNPATTCPTGAYYYKIQWTGVNGATLSALYPY